MRKGRLITLIIFLVCASGLRLDAHSENKKIFEDDYGVLDFYVPKLEIQREDHKPQPIPEVFSVIKEIRDEMDKVELLVEDIIFEESYTVFITAYCAEECGWNYWTSSGEFCHRSSEENRYEPTTCAIDLRYFDYGDLFYIPSEDRIYIAEDTGAFRGLWLDLYMDEMDEVRYYDTRYEEIYLVSIGYHLEKANKYDIQPIIKDLILDLEIIDE